MSAPANRHHYVYLIARQEGDEIVAPVKVGITRSLASRLAMLQTGSAYKLRLVCAFNFPVREIVRAIEQEFHHDNADERLSGEWFSIEPMMAMARLALLVSEMVEGLAKHAGDPSKVHDLSDHVGLTDVLKFVIERDKLLNADTGVAH